MLLVETKPFYPRWLKTRTAFTIGPLTVIESDQGLMRLHDYSASGRFKTKAWLLQMEGCRIVDQRVV